MKETREIIQAYDKAVAAGKKTALATVVLVEGSAYRRPGARMLVTEDGVLTGAISGGCLEGDALHKAQFAIMRGQAALVKYDTTDDDDLKFGVQLGCNGIIHILIEPVDINDECNPVELLRLTAAERRHVVIVTMFTMMQAEQQPGTCLVLTDSDVFSKQPSEMLIDDAKTALLEKKSTTKQYQDGKYTAFIEVQPPDIALLIFGAGNDAIPLAAIAGMLGWQVNVIDGRSMYATPGRFPSCNVRVANPEKALNGVTVDERTVAVLLTHNYNYDLAMLKLLAPLHLPYIGVLGPKKKMQHMTDQLAEEGIEWSDELWQSVHGPSGYDIGAETAEEIALSIIAEIKATIEKRDGLPLREKTTTIHTA